MPLFDAEALAAHRRWITRLAAGERDAMQLLYHELAPVVHGIARRILEDPEDAREVVQDTFIKAWRQADQYRPERGEVVSWLVLMARHIAIDRLRHGARQQRLQAALERELADAVDAEIAPVAVESREAGAAVDRYLQNLTPAQRRALELAFFSGYTHPQISQTLRLPLGTVKNHLRRGLAKLRQLVDRHE